MQVTPPNPELAIPNICALCETKPEGARFVDTGINNSYIPPTPLTGRKYFCEYCVKNLATALGYVSMDVLQAATDYNAEIGAQLDDALERLEAARPKPRAKRVTTET